MPEKKEAFSMIKYKLQPALAIDANHTFIRDSFTWSSYLMLGYYTYLQATLGPLASVFQLKFHFSYTDIGIPTGAFALGMILVGLFGEQAIRPWAHRMQLFAWLGGIGMALGAVFLLFSQNIIMITISTFIMGAFGTLLQFTAQALLSDRHREQRATALTEANVITSGAAALAPLLVGGFQYVGLDWRAALFFAFGLLLLTMLLSRFTSASAVSKQEISRTDSAMSSRRFPRAFWLYWAALACSVAMEWSVVVWSAILLREAGLANSLSTLAVSLFFIAELGGRILGSRLTRFMQSSTLLLFAFCVTAPGLLLFWLAGPPMLKIAGLFLTGLGIANLFPLATALAMGTTPRNTSAASARLSLGVGMAILSAPLLLGRIADVVGIQRAFSLLLILLFINGIVIVYANSLKHRSKNVNI